MTTTKKTKPPKTARREVSARAKAAVRRAVATIAQSMSKSAAAPVDPPPSAILAVQLDVREDHVRQFHGLSGQLVRGMVQQHIARAMMREGSETAQDAWDRMNALAEALTAIETTPAAAQTTASQSAETK